MRRLQAVLAKLKTKRVNAPVDLYVENFAAWGNWGTETNIHHVELGEGVDIWAKENHARSSIGIRKITKTVELVELITIPTEPEKRLRSSCIVSTKSYRLRVGDKVPLMKGKRYGEEATVELMGITKCGNELVAELKITRQ